MNYSAVKVGGFRCTVHESLVLLNFNHQRKTSLSPIGKPITVREIPPWESDKPHVSLLGTRVYVLCMDPHMDQESKTSTAYGTSSVGREGPSLL